MDHDAWKRKGPIGRQPMGTPEGCLHLCVFHPFFSLREGEKQGERKPPSGPTLRSRDPLDPGESTANLLWKRRGRPPAIGRRELAETMRPRCPHLCVAFGVGGRWWMLHNSKLNPLSVPSSSRVNFRLRAGRRGSLFWTSGSSHLCEPFASVRAGGGGWVWSGLKIGINH